MAYLSRSARRPGNIPGAHSPPMKPGGLFAQASTNFQCRGTLVHRIKMQGRSATGTQLVAQPGHHIQPECADRSNVLLVGQ